MRTTVNITPSKATDMRTLASTYSAYLTLATENTSYDTSQTTELQFRDDATIVRFIETLQQLRVEFAVEKATEAAKREARDTVDA